MGKKDVLAIIKKFRTVLEAHKIHIEQILLYGSWAKGNAKKDSDIDLIVISPDFEGRGYWERIDLLSNAIYKIFAPIEAMAFTPKEWKNKKSLIYQFASEGESIK